MQQHTETNKYFILLTTQLEVAVFHGDIGVVYKAPWALCVIVWIPAVVLFQHNLREKLHLCSPLDCFWGLPWQTCVTLHSDRQGSFIVFAMIRQTFCCLGRISSLVGLCTYNSTNIRSL